MRKEMKAAQMSASDTKTKGDIKSSIHIHIPEIANNFPGENPNRL